MSETTISRRRAIATIGGSIAAGALAAVLPTPTRAADVATPAANAEVDTMRAVIVRAQACPDDLVALFLVHDGRLAVFANTRLIEAPAAVAWAERKASAGRVYADLWWDDRDA